MNNHDIKSRMHRGVCALLLLTAACYTPGCSRSFYRRQADIDAYSLVREKANHPHWQLPNYSISVDPRSRMYDPYAIDCPPLPPDDSTAHQLMHCVDNKRGYPFWHDNGDRPYVENPAWPEYVAVDDKGVLQLSSDDAVRLGLLHSRTYQQQLETLYLSALDVSAERFNFDTQFFAGYSVFGTWDARARTGLANLTGQGGQSRSVLEAGTLSARNPSAWTMRKTFTTGSTLAVNFANSLLWQLSGPDDYRGTTLIDFNLIQPLLRNAGRERVLATLTLAERVLLYNVRLMEQYRQGFYFDVMTGNGAGNGPSRAGGAGGGGSGLTNFSGLGAGGFGTLGGGGGGGAGAGGGATDTGAPQAGNYLGLLQSQRQIRNQEDNVRRLRRNLTRLSILEQEQPAQLTSDYLTQGLQVAQARQALINSESQLLNARNNYQSDLDTFKVGVLSLPPQICIEPADNMLDAFDLISQEIIRLPEDWETVLMGQVAVRREIPERIQASVQVDATSGLPMCRLQRYPELQEDLVKLRPALAEFEQFANHVVTVHLPAIQRDIEQLRQAVPRRVAQLEKLTARIEDLRQSQCELLPLGLNPLEGVNGIQAPAQVQARLEQSLQDAESSYQSLSIHFRAYAESLARRGQIVEELLADAQQTPEQLFEQLVKGVYNPNYQCGQTRILSFDVLEDITRELIELQILQAVARTESIELKDIDIRAEQALEVARKYRRDWMNARAGLVDSYRAVQFVADQLQGSLTLNFAGDIRNVGDNPFNLRSNTGRLLAGVQFDAPLTRLIERNNYREALINYQQARRNYYRFEDQIAQSLRGQLRRVVLNQINFELQRAAVIQAARQVMLNNFIDQESQRAQTTRVTAARDVVQAISDLLNAQNSYMSIWINYEVLRISLDFTLGTMQLDSEGLWIDPGTIGPDYGQYDPWVWRNGEHGDGHMTAPELLPPGKQEDALHALPPAFLLPAPKEEAAPAPQPDGPRLGPGRER
jgi:hypothetical protein